jgi:hypothetical protein
MREFLQNVVWPWFLGRFGCIPILGCMLFIMAVVVVFALFALGILAV